MTTNLWIINQYTSIPKFGFSSRHFHLAKHLANKNQHITLILGSVNYQTKKKSKKSFGHEQLSPYLSAFWIPLIFTQKQYGFVRIINWIIFALFILILPLFIRQRPKTIFYSSVGLPGALSSTIIAFILKSKFIFEVRDIWPLSLVTFTNISKQNPIYIALHLAERFILKKADLVVSPLPGLQDYLDHLKITTRFKWLPQAGEISYKPNAPAVLQKRLKRFKIAYSGTLNKSNDLDSFMDMVKCLHSDETVEFCIIGDGPLSKHLLDMKAQHKLDNLTIIGRVPQVELPLYLSEVDAFFHGAKDYDIYKYGICPIKISEYLCYHRPLLQSYSGSYSISDSYGCGISVPHANNNDLALAAKRLQTMDDRTYQKLCKNSELASIAVFNHKKVAGLLKKEI